MKLIISSTLPHGVATKWLLITFRAQNDFATPKIHHDNRKLVFDFIVPRIRLYNTKNKVRYLLRAFCIGTMTDFAINLCRS